MLSHMRGNWLAPLLVALLFTVITTRLQGGFDPGRDIVVFAGLFVVNYVLGLVIRRVVDKDKDP
jgi:hypothetical protein